MTEGNRCDIVPGVTNPGELGPLMGGMPPSARLVGVGFYVALCIVIGAIGGRELDKALGTDIVFTLIGLILGIVLGLWGLVVQLNQVLNEINRRRTEGKNG